MRNLCQSACLPHQVDLLFAFGILCIFAVLVMGGGCCKICSQPAAHLHPRAAASNFVGLRATFRASNIADGVHRLMINLLQFHLMSNIYNKMASRFLLIIIILTLVRPTFEYIKLKLRSFF